MAQQIVLLDTSILIDYYRKTNKANTVWVSLLHKGFSFSVSVITKYEIFAGATTTQLEFWSKVFDQIDVLPFNQTMSDIAVTINAELKRKRKQIGIADLFIAATAISNTMPIATLNRKHFQRIENLKIINE